MSSEAITYPPRALERNKDRGTAHLGHAEQVSRLQNEEDQSRDRGWSELTDECLLGQISEGHRDALGALYQRHAQSIRNVARRILREDAEADELLQEVFLYISRKAALFDASRGTARSWIYHVTYHRAFDRRRYLALRHFYDAHTLNESVIEDRGHYNESVFNYLAAKDLMDKFKNHLSTEQRETIHLYFVEGYSLREIADQTRQTLGNVRNHYYRGLERLRSHVLKEKCKQSE
jgi:RNA polymerase sigma-70 factor (ECF subfamily)